MRFAARWREIIADQLLFAGQFVDVAGTSIGKGF